MEEMISMFDENGALKPLEEIQNKIAELYNSYSQDTGTILTDLIDSEVQVDGEAVVNTFTFMNRNLYLCGEITHDHAVAFSDAIRFWNRIDDLDKIPAEERCPIKIYIDSPGGDLDATLSIIDSITLSKTPVWTITIGTGDSGGFFVGIAGHKRIAYPHSTFLFHEGACGNEGDAHKYIQFVDFYKKKLLMLKQIVLNKTKITETEYEKHKKDDFWLTTEEALQYGVIDEVATELI